MAESIGYSCAINIAAQEARGEYLAFCDSDTFMLPGWLESHIAKHRSSRNIGITSAKILSVATGFVLDYGIGRTFYNHFHPFRGTLHNHSLVSVSRQVQMACSANMVISKCLFFDLGMFDENLSLFYQDIDLCLRLKDAKKECWVISDALVFHKGGGAKHFSTATQVDERGYYTAKNSFRLKEDFELYLDLSWAHFNQKHQLSPEYVLVDLSSLNRHAATAPPIRRLGIVDSFRHPVSTRDAAVISLLESLDIKILKSRYPLVLFVDTFRSLQNNALWLMARDRDDDIVIDRHANMCKLSEVVVKYAIP